MASLDSLMDRCSLLELEGGLLLAQRVRPLVLGAAGAWGPQ